MHYADTPVGFHRVNRGPLDSGEIVLHGDFSLYSYLNNEAAYPEQRLNVQYNNGRVYRIRLVQDPSTTSTKFIPVVELPGFELVTRKIGNDTYGLVYYNNGGQPYSSRTDYCRLNDPLAWDALPLMGIISGQLNNDNIDYCLTVNGEDHLVSTPNFLYNQDTEDDDDFFYEIDEILPIGIMPKYKTDIETKLLIKCNDYAKVSGGM